MDFDEGNVNGRQRVTQGHAGVRVAAGIDDDETDSLLAGGLNAVDQFAFVIALELSSRTPQARARASIET